MIASDVFQQSLAYFLRPVEDLLADAAVSEVMINGPETVYVERGGTLVRTPNRFDSPEDLLACARSVSRHAKTRPGC